MSLTTDAAGRAWLSEQDCDLEDLRALVEQTTDLGAYPYAAAVEREVLLYDSDRLRDAATTPAGRRDVQAELARALADGPGVVVFRGASAHAHRFDRVRINGLNIGWTDTEGEDATQRAFHGAGDHWRAEAARALPMGKLGQPDEIADFVVFLLSDRSGVVTGSVIDWDQNVLGALD